MKTVFIAGASGFIGQALIKRLLETTDCRIVAASRVDRTSNDPRLVWKKCDLFSLKELNNSLEGCDTAYYLVHSMLPSAALTQGEFYDFDLLLADNFARSCQQASVQHVIYLSGILPETPQISWHLRSRLEVEQTFRLMLPKVTTLRASLIIGPKGSSFTILKRLVERLPMMICPSWADTQFQPIDLGDMLRVLIRCLDDEAVQNRTYDVAQPEILTYLALIHKTATGMGKRTRVFRLNWIPLGLSRFWVALITQTTKDLVFPLVMSLRYPMIVRESHRWPYPADVATPIDQSLESALQERVDGKFMGFVPTQNYVRSIQRLPLPDRGSAEWATNQYFQFLPKLFFFIIKVEVQGNFATFYLLRKNWKLLILEKSEERSTTDRQLLYVRGGLLAIPHPKARLEMREVLDRQHLIVGIHDFYPTLPWFIYVYTQAIVHVWTMHRFGKFLANQRKTSDT